MASGNSETRVLSPKYETAPDGGQLIYTVMFQGQVVIGPSILALYLEGQDTPLGGNVQLMNATSWQKDESYQPIHGKTSRVRNFHNALRLELEENTGPGRKLIIEARAYDDAVTFRYLVPVQPELSQFRLVKEQTEFRFVKDATAYALELPNYLSEYESEFIKLPVSAFSWQGGVSSEILIGCPVLLEMPGIGWMAITDADLRDYSTMYLSNPCGTYAGHWFTSRLAPQVENPSLCVTGALPHSSSWRVLMVAPDPGRFIESNVLTSLNPPCTLNDTSWIQAGKSAWNWWSGCGGPDGKPAYTTEAMKYYVDFAAESGFRYMLIDGGWSAEDDITKMNGTVDVPEVVRYAAAKNVRIWIWTHSNAVARQMDEAFPLYEKWGVAGVKTDFVLRDDQKGMEFYCRSAEKAAQCHLMMDYHGATKPSGLERTWPNVMSFEAVAGMEQSRVGARDNPAHHLMLPYTRMLAGPMDYTPGAFDNVREDQFEAREVRTMVMGTRAHQLAMYVVYEAPFQMVSDWPENYKRQAAFQFVKDVPATWDETRVLNGFPGEFITVARRRGDEWFLGSMTNWTPRNLEVSLGFLGPGRYTAQIYADGMDAADFPKHVSIRQTSVQASTILRLQLAAGGGCAVRLAPMG
jgi:alpha-glucosidase